MIAILVVLFLVWLAIVFSPFLTRTWKSLAALAAMFLCVGLGVQWGVARFDAADVPWVMVEAGNIWLDVIQWAVSYTIAFRAVGLVVKSLGVGGRRLLVVNVLCVLAAPALWLAPGAWHAWDHRAAPAICLQHPLTIEIGGIRTILQWQENRINLYLGPSLPEDARYLFSPKSQRQLCAETQNGSVAVTAMAMVVRLDTCASKQSAPVWKRICAMTGQSDRFPHDVTLFVPKGLRLGYFSIPDARTSGPAEKGAEVIRVQDADGATLSAHCRPSGSENGDLICEMRRAATPRLDLAWEVYVHKSTVTQTLIDSDAMARRVCSEILGQDCPVQP
jgi:hypothetical protein